MANILFKRGLHAALPTTAVDGAFYLTTDSHRLYAGIGTKLVDLNKYITVVANADALPKSTSTPAPQEGDFAYITSGNILAVYLGGAWKQINQNTNTTNTSLVATGADNTLTFTLTDSDSGTVEETIAFIGSNGITTEVDANGNVSITGTTYDLETSLETDGFIITLSNDGNLDESSFAIRAGANVTLTSDSNGGIIITATDTTLNETNGAEASIDADNEGNLTVSITDTSGNTVSATDPNSLYYTVNGATIYNQNELPVYSKSEIDTKLNKLNPMSYKGTVGSAAALSGKETGAKNGDTYMVNEGFTGPNGESAKAGDLFIATGKEYEPGDDGATDENLGTLKEVTWTYVPSGDDAQHDTTYSATANAANNSITLKADNGDEVLVIDLNGDDDKITLGSVVTSTAAGENNILTTTISHAKAGTTNAVTPASSGSSKDAKTVVIPEQFVIDSTGHVASYKEKTYELATYELQEAVATAAGNVASVELTMQDSGGDAAGEATINLDASADDNLNVTATGNTVTISLEWGSF